MPADPLMLCYDGSEDAKHMIAEAGNLFPGEDALALAVRQTVSSVAGYDWAGVAITANFAELDHSAAEDAGRMAAGMMPADPSPTTGAGSGPDTRV